MSRAMRDFSSHFMQGLQLGAGWAEKWQAQKLAEARNKIMAERYAAQDRRENAKAGIYGQKAASDIELNKARAFRIMNPVAKGGGGGGKANPLDNPGLDALSAKWAARDGFVTPRASAPAGGNVTINQGSDASEIDAMSGSTGDSTPPAAEIQTESKGGMIRKMAEGGEVQLAEAPDEPKPVVVPFNRWMQAVFAMHKASGSRPPSKKALWERYQKDNPDGVGLRDYAGGGAVKSYAGGGSIEEGANMGIEEAMSYGGKKNKPDAGGALGAALGKSIGNFKPKDTILNAAPEGSGETYNRGGSVRQFQSGGRVLREPTAIDTGMSGPGSGYGQRASPPAGARRY